MSGIPATIRLEIVTLKISLIHESIEPATVGTAFIKGTCLGAAEAAALPATQSGVVLAIRVYLEGIRPVKAVLDARVALAQPLINLRPKSSSPKSD